MDPVIKLIAAWSRVCPLCIDATYIDAKGEERILFELCEYHRVKPPEEDGIVTP